jgi:alpha-L-rhamnosidase
MLSFQNELHAAATTLWEDWKGVSSLAHPVQGCVVSFFYEFLAGIRPILDAPGFKSVLIAPNPVRDLMFVEAGVETGYGTIRSEWKIIGDHYEWKVEIPPNVTANLRFPVSNIQNIKENNIQLEKIPAITIKSGSNAEYHISVGSGSYHFTIPR